MPSEFKETAEDLNTATDVQGNVNGSTTDRLAEIRARLDAATPGPWHYENGETFYGVNPNSLRSTLHYVVADKPEAEDDPPVSQVRHRLDAQLFANAPTDLTFLLSLVDSLQDELMMHRMSHSVAVGDAYNQHTKWQAAEIERLNSEVDSLQERLDTAEGRLAHFAAQHQPHDNLFKTCRTCNDGYGEPLPWPCADAQALGLDEEPSDV